MLYEAKVQGETKGGKAESGKRVAGRYATSSFKGVRIKDVGDMRRDSNERGAYIKGKRRK